MDGTVAVPSKAGRPPGSTIKDKDRVKVGWCVKLPTPPPSHHLFSTRLHTQTMHPSPPSLTQPLTHSLPHSLTPFFSLSLSLSLTLRARLAAPASLFPPRGLQGNPGPPRRSARRSPRNRKSGKSGARAKVAKERWVRSGKARV